MQGKNKKFPLADLLRQSVYCGFRGEDEQDSGLKANSDSGGKANGFRPRPGIAFTMPGIFPTRTATLERFHRCPGDRSLLFLSLLESPKPQRHARSVLTTRACVWHGFR